MYVQYLFPLLLRSLLTKCQLILTVSIGYVLLYHPHILKPLKPFISSEIKPYCVQCSHQPLSTVQYVNKIHVLTIVYGFYFTQCACI